MSEVAKNHAGWVVEKYKDGLGWVRESAIFALRHCTNGRTKCNACATCTHNHLAAKDSYAQYRIYEALQNKPKGRQNV